MERMNILVLDDEEGYREGLNEMLKFRGHQVVTSASPSEALQYLAGNSVDILLLDIRMPEMDGLEVLKIVKEKFSDIEVIVITGHGDLQNAIVALRNGAVDFLTKPFRAMDIEQAIERTRKFAEINQRLKITEHQYSLVNEALEKQIGAHIVGNSKEIKNILAVMSNVANSDDTTVLITGESGTGKELVARGIHQLSKRSNQFFNSVNCAAVPGTLFESEFFGHVKGAFSGATEPTPGWFEVSNNGTLFLDEISGLSITLQSKFLRVLDQRTICRLGSHKEIKLNIRIIAASNKDLRQLVKEGLFREDLFHRLNSFSITVPPLRDRKEDIPLLFNHFIQLFTQKSGKIIKHIEEKVYVDLDNYSFPGNVRELKNMVERAVILCNETTLRRKYLLIPNNIEKIESSNKGRIYNLNHLIDITIQSALEKTRGNKSQAARMLGISRQSLDRKLGKKNIK